MTEFSWKNRFLGFKSIKGQLVFSFFIFILFQSAIFSVFFWSQGKESKIREIADQLKKMNLKVQRASNLEKDFFIVETNNEEFYQTGNSIYIEEHKAALDQIKATLEELLQEKELGKMDIEEDVDGVLVIMGDFEFIFDSLVSNIQERGFQRHGLEGGMRRSLDALINNGFGLDPNLVITIRSLEKEYILRRDFRFAEKMVDAVSALERNIDSRLSNNQRKVEAMQELERYQSTFERLLVVDASIGLQGQPGLREILSKLSDEIEGMILEIDRKVTARSEMIKRDLQFILIGLLVVFLIINIVLGTFLFRSLSTPLQKLARSIHSVVDSNFAHKNIYESKKIAEISLLSKNFRFMLDKVEERANEVLSQKEQISNAYENVKLLSEIGQEITTYLSVDRIVEVLFQRIVHLIDTNLLMVGIHQPDLKALEFRGVDKDKGIIKHFYRSLDDKERIGIRCFTDQKILSSNHFSEDLKERWKDLKPTSDVEDEESIVYLPLSTKSDRIGVLTVQSKYKNAYSDFQFNLIRNLTVVVTSAMENALMYEKLEEKVKERTVEIVNQKKQIEQKNLQLTSSINYARRIQQAILPDWTLIQKHIPDSFIFYQPRDIVSGDFYWFHHIEPQPIYEDKHTFHGVERIFKGFSSEKIVIAAADCTGHGVPGAFMSMIGHEILNNVVAQNGIYKPNEILEEMHLAIRKGLRQQETDNRDGMDISICTIDIEAGQLLFAGAKNPLLMVKHHSKKNPELEIIKGDLLSVGGKQNKETANSTRSFALHSIPLNQEEDLTHISFFIFSDGFQDQFGGKDNTKFYTKRFRNLLWSIADQPMSEQGKILEKTFNDWKGNKYKQTDDILVIGFNISATLPVVA